MSTAPRSVSRRRRQHDHRPAARHRAADEAGVAALGHDRRARLGAPGEHGRHLVGVARAHHESGLALEAAGPVAGVAGGDVGVREDVRRRPTTSASAAASGSAVTDALASALAAARPAPGAAAGSAAPGRRGRARRTAGRRRGRRRWAATATPTGCRATRRPGRGAGRSTRSVLMNCTTSGSACRLNALPQSASGRDPLERGRLLVGQRRHRAHVHRQRAARRPLGRVAHLDGVAEPDPALGHPAASGTRPARCRPATAARRRRCRASPRTAGRSTRRRACRRRSTRTLPAPSTMRGASSAAVARPARTTSVSMRKPAIGTGRPSSTLMRASRWVGSVRSSARTSIAVGGPPWQASWSHGPRASSVGTIHSPPSAARSSVK